jgi:hypothetical protein
MMIISQLLLQYFGHWNLPHKFDDDDDASSASYFSSILGTGICINLWCKFHHHHQSSSYLYIYFPSVLGIRLFAAQFDQHHLISTLQVLFWSLEFFLHHRFDDDDDHENPKCEFGIGILFVATIFSYLGLWRFKLRTKTILACFLTARIATVSQAPGLQKRAAVLREFAMNLFVGVN